MLLSFLYFPSNLAIRVHNLYRLQYVYINCAKMENSRVFYDYECSGTVWSASSGFLAIFTFWNVDNKSLLETHQSLKNHHSIEFHDLLWVCPCECSLLERSNRRTPLCILRGGHKREEGINEHSFIAQKYVQHFP